MSSALSQHTPSNALAVAVTPIFAVPVADMSEFAALPEARRSEVQNTLALLRRVHEQRNSGAFTAAVHAIAASAKQQGLRCSSSTLLRKYYAYLEAKGDWRAVVRHYHCDEAQPKEFVQELKRVAELNHRSVTEAFRQLCARWEAGESIPGYGTWIEYYAKLHPERDIPRTYIRGFYPEGWSLRNLRRYGPSKASRVLFQQGDGASKKYFPSLKRDPSGLKPLELIVIDDFELDCLCVYPGDRERPAQIAPVAGLLAQCVGTRRKLVHGVGPRLEREEKQPDGTIKKVRCGIRRVDVQMLLHDLFLKYGLPDYPVTILCENATASISAELELSLSTMFDGRVLVRRTGLINHHTLTNGFTERGGRPWEKGWIESCFNQLWNILGGMPGYKGSNTRLNGPADLESKIAATKLLIGHMAKGLSLPPEIIALLRLPFPSPEMVERMLTWAMSVLDQRTDHKYIGFERVTEFLLDEHSEPQPFANLALLSPEQQMQVKVVERMESPLERWHRLSQGVTFTKIPESVAALMLLQPKKVTFHANAITFAHDKTGYSYVDPEGLLRGIPDNTELLGYFDPKAPEVLHLADLSGAFLGTLPRLGGRRGMIDVRDTEGLRKAGAVVATIKNRVIAELRERHSEADAQLALDRANNQAVLAAHKELTAGSTPAERIAAAVTETKAQQLAEASREKAITKAKNLDISLL